MSDWISTLINSLSEPGVNNIVTLVMLVILLVYAIVWLLLPFAVYGTKRRLDQMRKEQERTNDLLTRLVGDLTDYTRGP